jgi:hypothetical protein
MHGVLVGEAKYGDQIKTDADGQIILKGMKG